MVCVSYTQMGLDVFIEDDYRRSVLELTKWFYLKAVSRIYIIMQARL